MKYKLPSFKYIERQTLDSGFIFKLKLTLKTPENGICGDK